MLSVHEIRGKGCRETDIRARCAFGGAQAIGHERRGRLRRPRRGGRRLAVRRRPRGPRRRRGRRIASSARERRGPLCGPHGGMGQEGPHHSRHRHRHHRLGGVLVVPSAHQHPQHGHVDVRGRVHSAAAVFGVLGQVARLRDGYEQGRPEPGQVQGVQDRVVRAGARGVGGRCRRCRVAGDFPRQRREVRQRVADVHRRFRHRHPRGELLGDPGHRP